MSLSKFGNLNTHQSVEVKSCLSKLGCIIFLIFHLLSSTCRVFCLGNVVHSVWYSSSAPVLTSWSVVQSGSFMWASMTMRLPRLTQPWNLVPSLSSTTFVKKLRFQSFYHWLQNHLAPVLRIRDVYPGSWFFSIPDLGSRILDITIKRGGKKLF